MRPQWCMGTIGAVSDLVQKKIRQWRTEAIHNLYELEQMAEQVRGRLEADGQRSLIAEQEWINDLHSEALSIVSYLDRTIGMEQAGIL